MQRTKQIVVPKGPGGGSPNLLVATWHVVRTDGIGERGRRIEFPSETDQEHALTGLRDTVVNGVQERVAADEAELLEVEGDLLSDVAPSSVQDIWNVLDKDDERLQLADGADRHFPQPVSICERKSR